MNFSFMVHPCPLQAAMVQSEMNERLSPNMAPPTTEPAHRGRAKPEAPETAMAMGMIRVTVPTEVPMDTETTQLMMNRTAAAYLAGMTESMK